MVFQDHYAEGQDMKEEEVARPIGGRPSCCPLVKKKSRFVIQVQMEVL